jgi:hypothetical protein
MFVKQGGGFFFLAAGISKKNSPASEFTSRGNHKGLTDPLFENAMMNNQFPIPVTDAIEGLYNVYTGRQGFQVRKP